VHLDGYDQTDMITGKGPSKRHEVWYFAQTKLGALRVDNYKFHSSTSRRAGSAIVNPPCRS
jgi:hypothetical protein